MKKYEVLLFSILHSRLSLSRKGNREEPKAVLSMQECNWRFARFYCLSRVVFLLIRQSEATLAQDFSAFVCRSS